MSKASKTLAHILHQRPPSMLSELDLLLDVTRRLEGAGLDYMLTGSMALNHYAQPRMTRDIDIVIALLLQDLETLPTIFGEEFYFSPEAAREAILHQSEADPEIRARG